MVNRPCFVLAHFLQEFRAGGPFVHTHLLAQWRQFEAMGPHKILRLGNVKKQKQQPALSSIRKIIEKRNRKCVAGWPFRFEVINH